MQIYHQLIVRYIKTSMQSDVQEKVLTFCQHIRYSFSKQNELLNFFHIPFFYTQPYLSQGYYELGCCQEADGCFDESWKTFEKSFMLTEILMLKSKCLAHLLKVRRKSSQLMFLVHVGDEFLNKMLRNQHLILGSLSCWSKNSFNS